MKIKPLYPYTLKKEKEIIKLEIMPENTYGYISILCIAVIIMSSFSVVGSSIILFLGNNYTSKDYLTVICIITSSILFGLYAFYLLKWKRKGEEIFILHINKLENIIVVKPFKTEKYVFHFNSLEIGYQSGEDFCNEEEAKLLGIELDMDKVEGDFPIQFYMDNGEQVVDSERKIPIEAIRRIEKEFLLIKNGITNGF